MNSTDRSLVSATGLLALFALALLLRSLGAPFVFVDGAIDGDVLLDPWDGAYHARRAFYTFARFPEILFFDPYLRFPDGAPVPFPPLYDWLLGATARLFGSTPDVFGRVAAWASPVLSAMCLWPIFTAAGRLFDRPTAWLACALFAVFPASTMNAGVGDLDHHAAVGLWVACAVAFGARLVSQETTRPLSDAILGAVLRAALALSWTGSLLYLALFEVALLTATLFSVSESRLRGQATSAASAAVAIAPFVYAAGAPLGGRYSSTELSWLHVIALAAAAAVWAGMWSWQKRTAVQGFRDAMMRSAVVVGGVLLVLLLVPPLREALLPGLAFVAKADTWAPVNAEQAPLFPWMRSGPTMGADLSLTLFGGFAYLIPLLPLAPFLFAKSRSARPDFVVFAIWSGALGLLCLAQLRFGNDLASIAAIGFAALCMALARRLFARASDVLAIGVAVLIAIAVVFPVFKEHRRRLPAFESFVSGEEVSVDRSLVHGDAALVRFAERIREATPETSGYLDPRQRPEYSVLTLPSHGHVVHWAARRPTPANNFGPYLDPEKVDAVHAFYQARSEADAVAIVDELAARYVMTSAAFWLSPGTLAHTLHERDGSESVEASGAGRFRLVVESAAGSRMAFAAFQGASPKGMIAYKLWERVQGAVLLIDAEPKARVRAELELTTPGGRAFRYATRAWADRDGHARLRVPYATSESNGRGGVQAKGTYRVTAGERHASVAITDEAVRQGATHLVEWSH